MITRATPRGNKFRIYLSVIALTVVIAAGFMGRRLATREIDSPAPDVPRTSELVAQGAYLTRAADCAPCHTQGGGKPFAGGVAFKLPFGTLYSTNITADRETGIGQWSDEKHEAARKEAEEFVRATNKEAESFGTLGGDQKPSLKTMFEDVYEDMPWHLRRQRQQLGV